MAPTGEGVEGGGSHFRGFVPKKRLPTPFPFRGSFTSGIRRFPGTGRLDGLPLTNDELQTIKIMLTDIKATEDLLKTPIKFTMYPAKLSEGVGARHRVWERQDYWEHVIEFRSGVTYYELMHELEHALHFIRRGPAIWRELLTLAQKEFVVYQRLRNSADWLLFSDKERVDAFKQLTNDGKGFRDGSGMRGPEAVGSGMD